MSNHIHTSSVLQAAKNIGARNKKINLQKTGRRAKAAAKNRPSPVLGTRPTEGEEKWRKCDLAKILIDEAKVPVKFFGYGVDAAEQKMLLDYLPVVTTDIKQGSSDTKHGEDLEEEDSPKARYDKDLNAQRHKTEIFAKFLDLRNANAKGISYVNRRRIIFAFSTPQNPFDTGRTEVQGTQQNQVLRISPFLNFGITAALLTYKIRQVWKHLTASKSDTGNRLNLRQLVHQRAKILRYLKRIDRARYDIVLEKLALEPESVEGELVI